jgi:hypothetical protein
VNPLRTAASVLVALGAAGCLSTLDADRLRPGDGGFDGDVADDGTAETDTGCLPAGTDDCDGIDNDCDGATDEHYARAGEACDGDDSDLCREGRFACTGGRESCGDATGDSVETCNEVDDDCDGSTDEDFDLETDAANCGACGTVCDMTHVSAGGCASGRCAVEACETDWHDCGGDNDGCESKFDELTTCGTSCGDVRNCVPASAVHVDEMRCAFGACRIGRCTSGWAECNGVWEDGCEQDLGEPDVRVECASAVDLGTLYHGDSAGASRVHADHGHRMFHVLVADLASSSGGEMRVRLTLEVPENVDYDLSVWCGSCGSPPTVLYADRGMGLDEQVDLRWPDGTADDARHLFGSVWLNRSATGGCGTWTLRVEGGVTGPGGLVPCDAEPAPNCADGIDNDGDGWADADDLDCLWESPEQGWSKAQCNDGVDNDADTATDGEDGACEEPWFNSEELLASAPAACADGIDNDHDGWTDANDPDCAAHHRELGFGYAGGGCNNGWDEDDDFLVDADDPDCSSAEANEGW